jgi:hypothetical protein
MKNILLAVILFNGEDSTAFFDPLITETFSLIFLEKISE